MVPTRTEFLHISPAEQVIFYALALLSTAILAFLIWRRVRLWRRGKKIDWKPQGFRGVWEVVLLQRKVRASRRRSGAPMHVLIFYGFLSLFIATTLLAINTYSPVKFHKGTYYLIYEFTFDTLGLLLIVGVAWAMVRRISVRPPSLGQSFGDWLALLVLFILGVSGYLLEAARLGNKMQAQGFLDTFDAYSPVGYAIAQGLGNVSDDWYRGIWWFHAILAFGFISTLPLLRIRHILIAIFGAWGNPNQPMGQLKPISLEEVEKTGQIGVAKASDYSRWHLMSLDSCMECGRCTDVCPATNVGKILNPKKVVQDIRGAMASGTAVADAVSEEALWACTTCNACVEACPVLIRHVDLIVDARRYLVAEGRFSGSGAQMLRQIASTGNPWGASAESREEWMQGLEVPLARGGGQFDVLFWVGCAGATDPGAIKTTRAVAQLLTKAGVKFACLGREETCTGDPARRTGDEFLFQEKAQANIETLKRYNVKSVVTACPHCYNTLKNEYSHFGLDVEVFHHTQFLAKQVESGKLNAASPAQGETTLHDPCYLARVNGESDAPRLLLGEKTSLNGEASHDENPTRNAIAEPVQYGKKTLCCGAGGGRMWMEEPADQRPGVRRAKQLLESGAKTVAVACPFCKIMLDASIKQATSEDIRLVDLAEMLQEANA